MTTTSDLLADWMDDMDRQKALKLRAAVEAVLALHRIDTYRMVERAPGVSAREFGCPLCRSNGPCETRRAISAALGTEEESNAN